MPPYKEPQTLEKLSCEVLLAVLYHLTIKHDHDVTQSAARRQFLLANVLPNIKQKLVSTITSALNQDLNITCKLLDYTLDSTTTGLDLCKRNFANFAFPVDQVQTVYRLLVRAEPSALERLCMGITAGSTVEEHEEDEREVLVNWYTGTTGTKRKEEISKVLVYNSYIYPTMEKMKKLRHVVLHGVCDNQTMSIMGQYCPVLQYLDITGSNDVTDVGIQNLVFPLAIQKSGRVNLVNTRARTNPAAKQLHTVMAKATGVDMTGCIILLQFCPRLTKGGGRLEHESVGDAIYTLNKKLKVSNIILKELIDNEIDEEKDLLFSTIISKLEIINTHGKSLSRIKELCASNNSISELYLDFEYQDYTKDLLRFFQCYPGSNLKALEIIRMDEPIELDTLSETCPNLIKLKIMLCGVWDEDKLFWMYFSKLSTFHIKTSSTETLLSFMKFNISVCNLKISCPNEVKSKFNDAFIQTACSVKGFLPCLKSLTFSSKFPFGFQSAQRLIESLDSLQYIGPMDMFTKLSRADVLDLVKWVKDNNWNIVIGFKSVEYNVFEIDLSDPWKYKFVPDVGRIPVRKPSTKRLLSTHSGFSDDDDEISSSCDGRKRSRTGSFYLNPSQCSTKRSGSCMSLKKISQGSISIDHEITEFEFEFCLDSDGFIKNKDYNIPNYQLPNKEEPGTGDFEDDYDYDDEFDEDTMDVEDIPEDADFEWCWDDDGVLRIDEIGKEQEERDDIHEKQAIIPKVGVTLEENEKSFLEKAETELSFSSGHIEKEIITEKILQNGFFEKHEACIKEFDIRKDTPHILKVNESIRPSEGFDDGCKNASFNSVSFNERLPSIADKSVSLEERCSSKKSSSNSGDITKDVQDESIDQPSSSSRRAKKRFAQITPPLVNEEVKEVESVSKTAENSNGFRSSIIPPKAAKPDAPKPILVENAKTGKIVINSLFEKPKEKNNKVLPNSRQNKSSSNLFKQTETKPKPLIPAVAPPKTQIVEVFEYDPMLGYCTVKRKTVPIVEVTDHDNTVNAPFSSVNLSFLQSAAPIIASSEKSASKPASEKISQVDANSAKQEIKTNKFNKSKDNQYSEPKSEISEASIIKESVNEIPTSSGTSSKENKIQNKQNKTKHVKKNTDTPLIPLSSMSKYDIPFLNNILGNKSIPEPPKTKPPKLPKSVVTKLPIPKLQRSISKDVTSKTEIAVEVEAEENAVTVIVAKKPDIEIIESLDEEEVKEEDGQNASKSGLDEAKEWYWDYEKNCWKECDPNEEYEWEYIESDEEKELEKKASTNDMHTTVKLPEKAKSLQNLNEASRDVKNSTDSMMKKDKKTELHKEACSEGKKNGSQEFIDISEEDDDEISPLPKGAAGEWTTEKKQAAKLSRNRRSRESRKYSRQYSEEDKTESLSVSREDNLDEASPRRRRKGTIEAPKKSSLYDVSYIEDEESAKEISTRARRTRKGTIEDEKPTKLDRQLSKQSMDDVSKRNDGTIKRRNTNKKIDAEKAKAAASKEFKEKKGSDTRKPSDLGKEFHKGAHPAEKDSSEERDLDVDEDGEPKLDDKNVVFCMWGHENCKTRSHYRYNWQWDYVQKYAADHHKNMLQGYQPKESELSKVNRFTQDANKAQEEKEREEKEKEEKEKKPGKDGIRIRLQMLQNKLLTGKTSDSVKQKMFERDLELEMLRRKKNYQLAGFYGYL